MTALTHGTSESVANWRGAARELGSVVCIATADVDATVWTNSHHLMTRLASTVPVVFVESLGMRRPRLSRRDARRILRRLRRGAAGAAHRPDGLVVVSPLVIPWHTWAWARRLNRSLLARQLARPLADLPRPRVAWVYSPIAIDEVDLDSFDKVVYHCVDDFGTVPGIPSVAVRDAEERLAARADVVFVTAPALAGRLQRLNPKTILLPNVADTAHFAAALTDGSVPEEIERLPPPRVLYLGSMSDHKVDWELLDLVCDALPAFSFAFVGPVGGEARMTGYKRLAARENCTFLGPRDLTDLPSIMRGVDVGIVPYRLNAHTESVYPLKLIEYLAAGVPAVTTPLPALDARPDLPVLIASGPTDFARAIVRASEGGTTASREERSTSVMKHSWDQLLGEMLRYVSSDGLARA